MLASCNGDHNGEPSSPQHPGAVPSRVILVQPRTASPPSSSAPELAPLSDAPTVRPSARRWVVLVLFMCIAFFNQLQYTTYTPILYPTKAFYNISSLQVNLLAAIYPMVFVVFVVPVVGFYESRLGGFRRGMLVGAAANAMCGAIKVCSVWYPHYWLLATAQVLGGTSQVFLLSLPPMLASLWFPSTERTLATTICTLSGFMGASVALFYGPYVVPNGHYGDGVGRSKFLALWLSQCLPSVATFVASLIFITDRPPHPPSISARTYACPTEGDGTEQGLLLVNSDPRRVQINSLLEVMKHARNQLYTNMSLVRLMIAFGAANGCLAALITVLPQVLGPYGVSSSQAGTITSIGIAVSSATSVGLARMVDQRRRYKGPLMIMYAVAALCLLLMVVVFLLSSHIRSSDGMLAAMYALVVVTMAAGLPGIPITLEFVVEKTYPDPELIASSLSMLAMSLCSVSASFMYSAVLTDSPGPSESRSTLFITVGVMIGSIVLLASVQQDHRRHQFEGGSAAII